MPRESKDGEALPFGSDHEAFELDDAGDFPRHLSRQIPQHLPMISGIDDPPLPFEHVRPGRSSGDASDGVYDPGAPAGRSGSDATLDPDTDPTDSPQFPASALVMILLLIAIFGYVAIRQLNRYEANVETKAVAAPGTNHPENTPETPSAASPRVPAIASAEVHPAHTPITQATPRASDPGSALDAALQGEYATAARIWAEEKARVGNRYTLQLSVNCESRYLAKVFDPAAASSAGDEIFLLPVTIEERACYRVCTGDFPNEASARSGAQIRQRESGPGTPVARAAPLADLLTR